MGYILWTQCGKNPVPDKGCGDSSDPSEEAVYAHIGGFAPRWSNLGDP